MKGYMTILTLLAWLLGTALAAASGTVSGSVYPPGTDRGMQIKHGGVMWDVTAPKGSKSQVKAEIWLISREADLAAIPYASLKKWYQEGIIPTGQPIYHAEADEKGHFSFEEVPPAVYYLLILDPHGNEAAETLTEKNYRSELWKKMPHTDEFELFLVGMRIPLVEKITLREGQTVKIRPGLL